MVNIIVIYISEAHAADEWNLSKQFSIPQHKTVEQRIEVAKKYVVENECFKSVSFELFVDSIEHDKSFERQYCGWPERGFIVYKNKIEYIALGSPNDIIHWIRDIGNFVEKKLKEI